jgi:hypothetical protein
VAHIKVENAVDLLDGRDRSDTGIARPLWATERTVEKHVHRILTKLALRETDGDHRRYSPWSHFLRRRLAGRQQCPPTAPLMLAASVLTWCTVTTRFR